MAKRRKYGLSWSWKRAIGVSSMRGKIARATDIPTTRQGRQRKVGRMLGCGWIIAGFGVLILVLGLVLFIALTF